MPFETDSELAEEIGTSYGDYEGMFISEHQQIRADLFRRGDRLEAHLSFPTGCDGTNVTDAYVAILYDYAREHGFEDRLRFIYVDA